MKDVLTFKVKRPKKKKKIYKRSKEQSLDEGFVYITRIISRGDFNPDNECHKIKARVARKYGVIDENNNILKEEYLQCKTKR